MFQQFFDEICMPHGKAEEVRAAFRAVHAQAISIHDPIPLGLHICRDAICEHRREGEIVRGHIE